MSIPSDDDDDLPEPVVKEPSEAVNDPGESMAEEKRSTAEDTTPQPDVRRLTRIRHLPAYLEDYQTSYEGMNNMYLYVSNMTEVRQRTNTVPKVSTAKPKENKSVPLPGSSAMKPTWKQRPKAAHSGVPIPEKMKRLFEKQLQEAD